MVLSNTNLKRGRHRGNNRTGSYPPNHPANRQSPFQDSTMITDIMAALKLYYFFKRIFCRRQIKAKFWICNCQLIFHKNRSISSNHIFIIQRPDGNVSRRMTRRGKNLTAAAPVKSVSVMEQNIRKDRTEISVSLAKLFAKSFLFIRKLVLQCFTLLKPEVFPPSRNVQRFCMRSKNLNRRIFLLQFSSRTHMIIVLMGQYQFGKGAWFYIMPAKLFFYHKKRARITAINKHHITLSQKNNWKNMLLCIAKRIAQIQYHIASIHFCFLSKRIVRTPLSSNAVLPHPSVSPSPSMAIMSMMPILPVTV